MYTTLTISCQNRERERDMEKASRCELECRQYCLIGLESVQRKLVISLVGLLKHIAWTKPRVYQALCKGSTYLTIPSDLPSSILR